MNELIYALVAYFSNASCTLSARTGRHPIDFGKGVLGKNKTFEGLLFGLNAGLLLTLLLGIDFTVGLVISVSTQAGDLLGSFIKRRLGIKSGEELPITDQLGFITLTFFSLSFITSISFPAAAAIILLTYPAHRAANLLAFKLKLKKVRY